MMLLLQIDHQKGTFHYVLRKKITVTPTIAGGMVLLKAIAVALPTSLAVIVALVGCWDPGVTMLGLSKHPSRKTLLSLRALTTLARTFSVTSWHFWME